MTNTWNAFSADQFGTPTATKNVKESVIDMKSAGPVCDQIVLGAKDQGLINAEIEILKYPHPLEDYLPPMYNLVTGQIAPATVNVADSIMIGKFIELKQTYMAGLHLHGGFYNPISIAPIKNV